MLTRPCGRKVFQSTLPLRGATSSNSCIAFRQGISIHAPLAGSDQQITGNEPMIIAFQSTLPLRGATHRPRHQAFGQHISIHAPLAGSDQLVLQRR